MKTKIKILNRNIIVIISIALTASTAWFCTQSQDGELIDVTDFTKGKFEKDYWQVQKRGEYRLSDLVIESKASACIRLHYTITEQGLITDPVIVKEVNGALFSEALLKSLKNWQFAPAKNNEKTRSSIRSMKFFTIGSDQAIHNQCLI